MTLKSQLSQDAISVFLNTDEFAEEVTYTPYGGTPSNIKAIIDRPRIRPAGLDAGGTLVNDIEIHIANHATYGVTSIKKGFDSVVLQRVVGGDNEIFKVIDILGQDEGMWHLLVRK